MKTKPLIIALASIGIATLGAARLIEAATELARVNNEVITLEDFNKKYQDNLKFFQFSPPGRKAVLEDLIKRELGVQEARRVGLDRDPEIIERMNTVLYHALLDRQLSKEFEKIQVPESDARAFYEKNPDIRTSHVFVAVHPDAKPQEVAAARERIKKILDEQVRPGKLGFAEIAQRFSDGVAAPMGGDIDYQPKSKLDPSYYHEALKLRTPGKITGIVRSQIGFHIIKLTGIRPWDETDKIQAKRLLFEQKRGEIYEKYMSTLRQKAKVTVRSELIKD
ncbi:MAG: peptidylprolyl isomerase [Oligoflexia bacterium]|nr:peptidylprolyl isomerase [Oligoflexia bacterium]